MSPLLTKHFSRPQYGRAYALIGSRVWEIDWYQNEWPWPLFRGRIKVMSIALHSTLNISETVKVEAWFQRTANRNSIWAINGHVTDDVTSLTW